MTRQPRTPMRERPQTSPVTRSGAIAPTLGSEHEEQAALFQWAVTMEGRLPALMMLFAVPNGGKRHIATALKLKAEGVKAGVPDVWLPVPRDRYHGLVIEMKAKGNRPTPEQDEWLLRLDGYGYATAVAYGWMKAARLIVVYLGGQPEEYGL